MERSAVGHPGSQGDLSFDVANDVAHLLATCLSVGMVLLAASIQLPAVGAPVQQRLDATQWVASLSATATLAPFNEAFLVLRSQQMGIPTALVPLVMVLNILVPSATAYPFGKLSDLMSHGRLLGWGLCVLVAADLVSARANGLAGLLVGIGLWGVHMGMTQGLFATMVADTAPDDLRGTAYGVFILVGGLAMLLASVQGEWLPGPDRDRKSQERLSRPFQS